MTTETTLDTGIIERIEEAFNRRDLDAIAAELTEDVVFHPTHGPDGDVEPALEGREAVMEQIAAMMQVAQQTFEHHNTEVLGGYVVGIATVTFPLASGNRHVQIIDVCRLRDGKLAERWTMVDRPDEFQRIATELGAE